MLEWINVECSRCDCLTLGLVTSWCVHAHNPEHCHNQMVERCYYKTAERIQGYILKHLLGWRIIPLRQVQTKCSNSKCICWSLQTSNEQEVSPPGVYSPMWLYWLGMGRYVYISFVLPPLQSNYGTPHFNIKHFLELITCIPWKKALASAFFRLSRTEGLCQDARLADIV